MTLALGASAPDFCVTGTDGTDAGRRDYSLSDYSGQPVVLVFYPADHSPVCTVQLQTYSHDIGEFAEVGAQVLALSPQSVDEHERFLATNDFAFPLLADADKAVGEQG
jgi:peroxiredoxin Q/BCP